MELLVTVVGGTGFIGARLVERLQARGASVRVVSRHAPNPTASARQVEHLDGDIQNDSIIDSAVDGVGAVVNLIGTTAARTARQFFSLHRDVPRRLARAARRAGIRRFVHVSAMGVRIDAPSMADRSKAEGEHAVREAFPQACRMG